MKDVIKWFVIALVSMFMLTVAVLLIAPNFIDINRYKPAIEREITLSIGRPCLIDGRISISFVPSLGLHFSGFHIGNPPGFSGKDFVYIKSFDTKVEFLPLFSKEFKIKHIILDGVRIVFEKRKDGVKNWSGLCVSEKMYQSAYNIKGRQRINAILKYCIPVSYLNVKNFTVTNASLLFIDHSSERIRKISDVNINIAGISFEHPMDVDISATVDSYPVTINGTVGPVARDTRNGTLPISLTFRALSVLTTRVTGKISNPCYHPSFDFRIETPPFSLKKLAKAVGFKIKTKDPNALNKLWLKTTVRAKNRNISFLNGHIGIDSTNLGFSGLLKGFGMPYLSFEVEMDHLDLDHYLPVSFIPCSKKRSHDRVAKKEVRNYGRSSNREDKKGPVRVLKKVSGQRAGGVPVFLSLLSGVPLNGSFSVKDLRVYGVRLKNVSVKIHGRKGTFRLKPISFDMYDGHADADAAFYLTRRIPISVTNLHIKGVQTGPLFKDITGKFLMEGRADCDLYLKAYGRTLKKVRRRVYGSGKFLLLDGAFVGIDINRALQNNGEHVGRTKFSKLYSAFTIKRGILHTDDTEIVFPDILINLTGNADMVNKRLDLRLMADYRQHHKKRNKRRWMMTAPVLITGTFSSPRLSLDIANTAKKGIKNLLEGDRINGFFDKNVDKKKRKELLNDVLEDLLNGFISK